jgi:oligopeptide/dipeptide ABC transporter ATP-binding protein
MLLDVDNVTKVFSTRRPFERAVQFTALRDVSLQVARGESFGLVGESGSGKTTLTRCILRLEATTSGRIVYDGQDLATLSARALRALRAKIQIVFQDPYASLNPRMTVRDIVAEPLEIHHDLVTLSARARTDRAAELLALVGLRNEHLYRYPHEFSGGQRQRIGIARALALQPKLVVLDEPVSALDVSIRAGVINLLEALKTRLQLSYLFVAHDLSVVRHVADRVAVMYLGKLVEIGDIDEVFDRPAHPYTQALLSAIPLPDPLKERRRKRIVLQGDPPNPADPPSGCRFRTRCPKFALELDEPQRQQCIAEQPALIDRTGSRDRLDACHYAAPLTVL